MGIEIDDSNSLATLIGSCSDLIADFKVRNDGKDVEDDDDDEKVRIGVCWEIDSLVILEMYAAIVIFVDEEDDDDD